MDEQWNMLFRFLDEDGENVLTKHRLSRKFVKGKDKTKTWQDGNGRPILFGMNKADPTQPLVITEGEFDAMSVHEAGIPHAVSVPFGPNNFYWLDEFWECFEQFSEIVLWYANAKAVFIVQHEAILRFVNACCNLVRHIHHDATDMSFRVNMRSIH